MRSRVLRVVTIVGLWLGALTIWQLSRLPRPDGGSLPLPPTEVTVAFHVHSTRSDGTGTIDDIATAAVAAGIQAVVVTDHGDGTRTTEPPRYLRGVLMIDAVEIGTRAGHYVALGAGPSPFPLGGDPAAVVEDVASERGRGIVAHPTSTHDGLAWRDWDLPFDGLEWLNADSEWRDRPRALWSTLLTYPWRPVETVTALLDRPVAALAEWDRQTTRRRVAGFAAHDAHARIGLGGLAEPYDGAVAVRAPSYETMFRAFTNVVVLETPLPADAGVAALAVTRALVDGRTYAVVTGQRGLRPVTFAARSHDRVVNAPGAPPADHAGLTRAGLGMDLPLDDAVAYTFAGAVDAPPSATSRLVCGGREVASARGGRVTWTTAVAPGACRFEVHLGEPFRVPWVVTNPIYVRTDPVAPDTRAYVLREAAGSERPERWIPEHAPASSAGVAAGPPPLATTFQWSLGAEPSPFAALRFETPADLGRYFGVFVSARADRPQRVWLQLRSADAEGRRWGTSVRLAGSGGQAGGTTTLLRFDDFVPLDGQDGAVPLDRVAALLLVVDTVHNHPGDTGVVHVDRLRWAEYAR